MLLELTKLTEAFTRTSLPLNLYTSVLGCGCSFGFAERKARIGGFAYPYSPPPILKSDREKSPSLKLVVESKQTETVEHTYFIYEYDLFLFIQT